MSKQPSENLINLVGHNRKIQNSFGFTDNHEEKNIELFAGAGGFGWGAARAGMYFHVGINHSASAMATHKANFPHSTQMINDVFEYHPHTILLSQGISPAVLDEVKNFRVRKPSRYAVGHLHLSPDCTFHSRAKGKKKVLNRHTICGDHCDVDHTKLSKETAERIRGLAWVGVGWAAAARCRRITLENVSEFLKWGPTIVDKDGDIVPDPKREGETFEAFKGVLTTGISRYVSKTLPKVVRFVNPHKLPKRKPKHVKCKTEWAKIKLWFNEFEDTKQQYAVPRAWHNWKEENPSLSEIRRFLVPFLGNDYNEDDLIKGLGYDVEFRELVASDYGAPTSRKRLFMMARCDGVPIEWPEITHGDPESDEVKSGKLLPWRTAGECIDWSVIAPSIFDTKEEIMSQYGISVRRPLVVNSFVRISRGIVKYVIETNKPYVVKINPYGEEFRGQSFEHPLQAIPKKNGYGIAMPFFQSYYGPTENQKEVRGSSLHNPLLTITAGGQRHGLVIPYITGIDNASSGASSVWSAQRPLTTIVTENRHAFTAAYVVNAKGTNHRSMPIGNEADNPMTTITAHDTHGVVMAHLLREFGQSIGSSFYNPVPTIMSGGGGKTSIVAAYCIKMKGDNIGYSCHEPVQTITAGGLAHGLVASHLFKYYGAEALTEIPLSDDQLYKAWQIARMLEMYADVPVPMLGGIPLPRPHFVRTVHGHIIADIGMRMLNERELFRAQGFSEEFIYKPEVEEYDLKTSKVKRRKITKTESVRQCGNAVPPPYGEALVKAMNNAEAKFYNRVT